MAVPGEARPQGRVEARLQQQLEAIPRGRQPGSVIVGAETVTAGGEKKKGPSGRRNTGGRKLPQWVMKK